MYFSLWVCDYNLQCKGIQNAEKDKNPWSKIAILFQKFKIFILYTLNNNEGTLLNSQNMKMYLKQLFKHLFKQLRPKPVKFGICSKYGL